MNKREKKIAVILTVHNRREKTVKCLRSLYYAYQHNKEQKKPERYVIDVFITDDGCTDGTNEAIREEFASHNITIVEGDGNLYWAGGMRKAWSYAMSINKEWDFYLLLNDDVELMPNVFEELFNAHRYALENYGKEGIYSGITCDTEDHEKMTYGGDVWVNRFFAKSKRLEPNGIPQLCDVTNANILMVSKSVVEKMGVFYKGYVHGSADQDYSFTARKNGFPVLLTANFCGKCAFDHLNANEEKNKILKMSLKERRRYFKHPLHSSKEQIISEWRMTPWRAPLITLGRFLNLYFPRLYYKLK